MGVSEVLLCPYRYLEYIMVNSKNSTQCNHGKSLNYRQNSRIPWRSLGPSSCRPTEDHGIRRNEKWQAAWQSDRGRKTNWRGL